MKRLLSLVFTTAMLTLVFAGCEEVVPEESDTVKMIELAGSQSDNLEVAPEGESIIIRFTSAAEWSLRVSGESDWLEISPTEGEAGMARVTIKASANNTEHKRTSVVELCSGATVVPITLSQEVFVSIFKLSESEKEVSCLGRTLTVNFTTNVDYEFDILVDWIKHKESETVAKDYVEFVVEPNDGAERTGMITFCAGGVCTSFTVKQRAAGTAEDDWKSDQFHHRSLAMRFTADWCGYCPNMATAFNAAKEELSGGLELVSLHGNESSYYFDGTNDLVERFGVTGFPTGVVDCRAMINNNPSSAITTAYAVEVAKETKTSYPVTAGIACSSILNGNELTMDIDLYMKEKDVYRIVVLLLEDGIVGYQNNGGNNYVHDDIARLAVTSMNGDRVETTEDYQIVNKIYTATVNPTWEAENLKLLIYVEKPYGVRDEVTGVKGNGVHYGNYGDTYIDNCRVVKIGVEAPLELK